jgi:hypothetical protein
LPELPFSSVSDELLLSLLERERSELLELDPRSLDPRSLLDPLMPSDWELDEPRRDELLSLRDEPRSLDDEPLKPSPCESREDPLSPSSCLSRSAM